MRLGSIICDAITIEFIAINEVKTVKQDCIRIETEYGASVPKRRQADDFWQSILQKLRTQLCLAIVCLFGNIAVQQTLLAQEMSPASQTGNPINTSADDHGSDSVNTQGLGLHIEIPMLTLQERGRTFTWKYVYNTPTYEVLFFPIQDPAQPKQINKGSWSVVPPPPVGNRPSGQTTGTLLGLPVGIFRSIPPFLQTDQPTPHVNIQIQIHRPYGIIQKVQMSV